MGRTRFVVFGQGRSGSTLVLMLLQSHPQVDCDRELFNPTHDYLRGGVRLATARVLPVPFAAWRASRARAPVYGFKLLVGQVPAPRLTLRLLHMLGWRIVHIRREDVVAQTLSGLVAARSRRWGRQVGEALPLPRVRIQQGTLVRALRARLRDRERERHALAGLPHLCLAYERDLLDERNRTETALRLCRHLGIEERPLRAQTAKLYDVPYTRIVEDGEELVRRVEELLGSELGPASACARAPSS